LTAAVASRWPSAASRLANLGLRHCQLVRRCRPSEVHPMKAALIQPPQQQARAARSLDRERARDLIATIHRRTDDVKDSFFEIGTALAELANDRLYLALGHRSFAELVERE